MTSPPHPTFCPECGKPVPEESQHQVCPACLMAQALASRTLVPEGEISDSFPPPSPEEIADKFPQFEITECLGRGGMGVVYKARQKSLDRWVAIKILPPERVGEARFADRFAKEAQTLAKLNHPNIVTVFDYGEADGLYFIVMEFVDGVNLRDLLRDGRLEAKQALAIVPPVCEALQFAHDKGIVHRDIKPENLLLDRDGRIKIADFGIASLIGAGGENIGTPPYMAPEQSGLSQQADHRADIYALGVVLYEMLTGERPSKNLVAPSSKVRIDVRLDEMVLRALEKSPELRYQTAREFRTVVETMRTPAASTQAPQRVEEKRMKRRKKVIFRLLHGTPSRKAMLMIALFCITAGPVLILAGEPLWNFLTSNEVGLIPSKAREALPVPPLHLVPWLLGAIGVSIILTLAIFGLSMNLVVKGQGSGPGKGLTLGCLGLMFGGIILALATGGMVLNAYANWNAVQHPFPALDGLPVGYSHPPISPSSPSPAATNEPMGAMFWIAAPMVMIVGALSFWRHLTNGRVPVSPDLAPRQARNWKSRLVVSGLVSCGLVGTFYLIFGPPRLHPLSSLNSYYRSPLIGRVEFSYYHPNAITVEEMGYHYDIKQGGDTRWEPTTGRSIPLIKGKKVVFRTRVDARGEVPKVMVAASTIHANSKSGKEIKELSLHSIPWIDSMKFGNGLYLTIKWTPVEK